LIIKIKKKGGSINKTPLYCASSTKQRLFLPTLSTISTPSGSGPHFTHNLQDASYSPNLALQGDNVYVIWTQGDGNGF